MIAELERAKSLTVISFAAVYDILSSVQAMNDSTNRFVDEQLIMLEKSRSEIQKTGDIDFNDTELGKATRNFLLRASSAVAEAAAHAGNMHILHLDLVYAVGESWLSVLDELFASPDRRAFQAKVDMIRKQLLSKFPVVGNIVELLFFLQEISDPLGKEARSADDYLRSIDSYCDAAYAYLSGAINFCIQVEHFCARLDPPTHDQLIDRIRQHFESVQLGSHPATKIVAPEQQAAPSQP